jgi:hypothetical protein
MKEDVKANLERVRAASAFLFQQFLEYAAEHELSLVDVFMVGHNFHKQIVTNIAARGLSEGMEPTHTFREADMTWRMAMREMSRARFEQATAPRPTEPEPKR